MGHAAVTTKISHFFSEKFARGGVGQAGAQASPFKAWIDDWNFSGDWDNAQLNADVLVAFGFSFCTALLAIVAMMAWLRRASFTIFALYRFLIFLLTASLHSIIPFGKV